MQEATTPRQGLAIELARLRVLVTFVGTYYAMAVALGFGAHRPGAVLYSLVTAALIAVFAGIHLRFGLSDDVLWALAVLGAMHLAGGLIPSGDDEILYNAPLAVSPLQVDRLVHAYGTGVLTVVAWQVMRPAARSGPTSAFIVLAALAAMGTAAIEEIAEFSTSRIAPTHVGGYVNTGWDLVFNLIGCLTVAVWLFCRVSPIEEP